MLGFYFVFSALSLIRTWKTLAPLSVVANFCIFTGEETLVFASCLALPSKTLPSPRVYCTAVAAETPPSPSAEKRHRNALWLSSGIGIALVYTVPSAGLATLEACAARFQCIFSAVSPVQAVSPTKKEPPPNPSLQGGRRRCVGLRLGPGRGARER